LYDCVDNLPVLRELTLGFHSHEKVPLAWHILAPGPPFPALSSLNLSGCKSSVEDFGTFIVKHCNTLTDLRLFFATLDSSGRDGYKDLHVFFATLATFPLLEEFRHSGLHLDGVEVTFPDMFELDFSHGEDEDGWIQVHKRYHYQEFEGRGGAGRIKADGSESRMSPNSATDVGDSRLSERLALIVELRLCGIFTTPPRSSPAHFSGSYCLRSDQLHQSPHQSLYTHQYVS
jgi:hypothetical protein